MMPGSSGKFALRVVVIGHVVWIDNTPTSTWSYNTISEKKACAQARKAYAGLVPLSAIHNEV
jgi:hypothetical protein